MSVACAGGVDGFAGAELFGFEPGNGFGTGVVCVGGGVCVCAPRSAIDPAASIAMSVRLIIGITSIL